MINVLAVTDKPDDIRTDLASAEEITLQRVVETAGEAIQVAKADPPDILVMDYDVLGPGAADAARTILLANDDIQVIMLSVVNDVEDIRHAMRAGARDYLIKPLGDGELADTIQWLINERRDYARMSAFVGKLRRAYETLFYDDQPVPERVVTFLEAQADESPSDQLTLETLAVAYARNRAWGKLAPLVERLAEMEKL